MANIYGADIEQLRLLSDTFDRQANELASSNAVVSGGVQSSAWFGPIAVQFKTTWTRDYSAQLRHIVEILRVEAKVMRAQAQQQDAASVDDDSLYVQIMSQAPTLTPADVDSVPDPVPQPVSSQPTNDQPASVQPSTQWLDQIKADGSGYIDWYDAKNKNQCVDLANAYVMGGLFGLPSGQAPTDIWSGYHACDYYNTANPKYFTQIPPGGHPQAGDVVVFNPTTSGGAGHIAVVKDVAYDANGNVTSITVIEQNVTGGGQINTRTITNFSHLEGYLQPNYDAIAEYRDQHGLTPNNPASIAEKPK